MGSELETLFRLQELDLRLQDKQAEVHRFESGLAARRQALEKWNARAEELTGRRKRLVTDRALAERRLTDAQALLQDRRQRLTRVRTERELRAGEGEITSLAEEIDKHEEALLLVMEQVEAVEQELAEAQAQVKDLQEADHRQIEVESARIEALRVDLQEERKARDRVASDLDLSLRSRYERVLERRTGRAVVEILDGSCSGCRMHIPPQVIIEILKRGAVKACPSCQRILFIRE